MAFDAYQSLSPYQLPCFVPKRTKVVAQHWNVSPGHPDVLPWHKVPAVASFGTRLNSRRPYSASRTSGEKSTTGAASAPRSDT